MTSRAIRLRKTNASLADHGTGKPRPESLPAFPTLRIDDLSPAKDEIAAFPEHQGASAESFAWKFAKSGDTAYLIDALIRYPESAILRFVAAANSACLKCEVVHAAWKYSMEWLHTPRPEMYAAMLLNGKAPLPPENPKTGQR